MTLTPGDGSLLMPMLESSKYSSVNSMQLLRRIYARPVILDNCSVWINIGSKAWSAQKAITNQKLRDTVVTSGIVVPI